jgi:putative DNA primase/helicase
MSLHGKRIVWAGENDEGRALNVAKVKWLVGGDTLVGRHVQGKKEIRFKPTHTLFLLTNHKPRIPADDPAIWQRLFLIEFKMSFVDEPKSKSERKRDPNIRQKLFSEAPGILAWLVKGFMEYHNYGLNPPDSVKINTSKYREDEDIIGQFITECCSLSLNFKEQAGPLYSAYKGWCELNSYTAIGSRKFGEKMVQEFKRVQENGCRYYKGIKLIAVIT